MSSLRWRCTNKGPCRGNVCRSCLPSPCKQKCDGKWECRNGIRTPPSPLPSPVSAYVCAERRARWCTNRPTSSHAQQGLRGVRGGEIGRSLRLLTPSGLCQPISRPPLRKPLRKPAVAQEGQWPTAPPSSHIVASVQAR